ncbi:unnamed protein product [Rhizoctonia solani]|uniref:CHAT domain-containing protein n=1 Tax=Rhizoctonia solani TaxID=456999 RepID=A0A8H3HDX1_9AGAM|nr:unnamed protein product [Rhizoctonia solani]
MGETIETDPNSPEAAKYASNILWRIYGCCMRRKLQEESHSKTQETSVQLSEWGAQCEGEPRVSGLDTGSDSKYEELHQLGKSHRDQFRRFGELGDLEKSIEYHSRAFALIPDGHPDQPREFGNLGLSYTDRFGRLKKLEDLEKAMECNSRAFALTPSDHPDSPRWLANLGVSYNDRFRHLGELEDLEKAIECGSRAVTLALNGHPDLPRWLANLGMFYTDRFQHLGELKDLDKAMEHKSRAVDSTPDDHPELPRRLANLGMTYTDRFRRLGRLQDIEKAIECNSRAVALTPDDNPIQSRQLSTLAVSYSDRFHHTGKLEDAEKAIEYGSRAAGLLSNGHPELAGRLSNLGVFHTSRFWQSGGLADLDKAMEHKSLAVESTPEGDPTLPFKYFQLAISYFLHYLLTNDRSYSDKTLDSFRKASQQPTGAPRNKFQYATTWANLASKDSSLSCLEAYQVAINLLPQFIWLGASTNQRYQDLLAAGNLAVNAATVAVLASDYPLALEWLEHARCVVWNQSLMLRSPLDQLHTFHPELAANLQKIANQLNSTSSETQYSRVLSSDSETLEQVAQKRRRLAKEYHILLAEVRRLPDFEDFLQATKANILTRAARNGPIVVINCHADRCDALFIFPGRDDISHLSLPDFTQEKAQQARFQIVKSLAHKGIRERGIRTLQQPGHKDRFVSVLLTLWNVIVKPVLDFLGYTNDVPMENLPHITWCPTGALSFLPLHAAGDYDQPGSRIFDYVISSYTPTLTALLAGTPRSLNHDCRVLAIGQAATPGRSPLPGTVDELAYMKSHTQNKVEYSELIDNQATTTAVLDAMEQHDWVHLACHAHQNVEDPTKSGFFLHDGTLDLASINRRSFKNKGLAFLSACQTATGDERLPDESIHLASGMLMAGYPSVIATMWSVSDRDAPFVTDKVYAELMKDGKIGNGEAGKALHFATAALRDKIGEKEFGRWVPYIHIGS